jgi:hypothetical protein
MRFNRQIFVLPLVACLFLVPALVAPAAVSHEIKHSHHHASTHSSALCSWFCAAGQGFDLVGSVFVPTILFLAILHVESANRTDDAASIFALSRGPPARSLSLAQ